MSSTKGRVKRVMGNKRQLNDNVVKNKKKARIDEQWVKVVDALTPEDDNMPLEECCKRGKLLQTLLKGSGYIRDGFITEHYLKSRPLLLRDGATGDILDDICGEYLGGLDIEEMLEASSSDTIHVWLTPNGPFHNEPATSIELHDPSAAIAALKTGAAQLYFPAPQPLADLMCRSIADGLGIPKPCQEYSDHTIRSEIETFICRKGHNTDWHTDFQTNFTIQLSGRKRWTLKKAELSSSSSITYPIRGRSPHFSTSSNHEQQLKAGRMQDPYTEYRPPDEYFTKDGTAEEVILSPGDVLFHPAGVWHKGLIKERISSLIKKEVVPLLTGDDERLAEDIACGLKGHIPKLLDLTKPEKVIKQLADIIELDDDKDRIGKVYVFNRLATVIEAPEGELSYALSRALDKEKEEATMTKRNVLLVTDDGMVVAAAKASDESSKTIGAVAANVYMEYKCTENALGSPLTSLLMQCEYAPDCEADDPMLVLLAVVGRDGDDYDWLEEVGMRVDKDLAFLKDEVFNKMIREPSPSDGP
ncbi:hypothetical protein FOL47_008573 [Perkinsus chesapeaki]|uniref:Cupin-like domain-containing protein n=1 Tax=Perkinsus chesapeaki TaxID=330153 RepID=A0A7J6LDU7_PERCH|nr:hypothetical protein FOL47_008573 [Perkinsus chesapeaki]